MSLTCEHLAQEIIDAGRFLYDRRWSPATSSKYSTRLSPTEALPSVAMASTCGARHERRAAADRGF